MVCKHKIDKDNVPYRCKKCNMLKSEITKERTMHPQQEEESVYVCVFDKVKHETEKAWLLEFEIDSGLEAWLPKSQCEMLEEADLTTGKCGRVQVPHWLMDNKDLWEYEDD